MRKSLPILLVLILLLSAASCRQYQYPYWPPIHDNNEETEKIAPEELIRKANMPAVYEIIGDVLKGREVKGMNLVSFRDVTPAGSSVISARAASEYEAVISFNGYEADNSVFIFGSMTFRFTGTDLSVSSYYSVTEKSLTFSYESNDYDVSISMSEPVPLSGFTVQETQSGSFVLKGDTLPSPSGSSIEITVDDNAPITPDDIGSEDSRFESGNGTADDPFVITNETQFGYIADYADRMNGGQEFYFEVTQDLDFSDIDYEINIPILRGAIDFNNKSLEGCDEGDFANSYIFGNLIGTISNLNYSPDEAIALTLNVNQNADYDDISMFENVTVNGTFNDVPHNFSLYMAWMYGSTLKFNNCVSNANYYGSNYAAVFVGGAVHKDTKLLEFVNCTNNGDMYREYSGLLVGNAYGPNFALQNESHLVVENVVNNGTLYGTKSAGAYCGIVNSNLTTAEFNSFVSPLIKGTGTIGSANSNLTADYDADFTTLKISGFSSDVSKLVAVGSIYAVLYTNVDRYTQLTEFKAEKAASGNSVDIELPALYVVDSYYATAHKGKVSTDSNGNDIFIPEGASYHYYYVPKMNEYHDETVTDGPRVGGENGYSTLTYEVLAYDQNGRLLASVAVANPTEPISPSGN